MSLRLRVGTLVVSGIVSLALGMPAWAQEKEKSKDGAPAKSQPEAKAESKEGAKKDAGASAKATAAVGQPAPDFALKATDGKTYKLSELKDKIVVLEWFNKDCPVCQGQAAQMKETSAALSKQGVVWLAIDSTKDRKVEDNVAHAKNDKLPHPVLDDSSGAVGRAYGAKFTPTVYVINKGTLVYSGALIPSKKGENRNYVREAVEAVVAGKEVPLKETQAYGCTVKY